MRIVILSCNTGEGHNATGKAIRQVLESRGVECEMVDVLACLSRYFSKFISDWHERLYKYAPKLWDVGYRAFEMRELKPHERAMMSDLLALGKNKLRNLLEEGQFDAVICTHVFSGMMMTELRKVWSRKIPCYLVATDYTCYPYMDRCAMDGYFIPAASLTEEYADDGLPRDKLIPTGIPVRQEFYSREEKDSARKALSLPGNDIVVLLMCGSMGCGPLARIARELAERLPKNAVLVTFCGKNKKLHETMSAIEDPRLRVLGFTDEVSRYMDAADLIVTKPGGLSSTEAANKRLPMVLINAIGGCENRNFQFFLNRGYAIGSNRAHEVVALAGSLAGDVVRRRRMIAALEEDFVCNSGLMIADIVMNAVKK